ncbi:radical SAM protein, partial [Chloroflexota bacterium]
AIQNKIKERSWQSGRGGRVKKVAGRVFSSQLNESLRNVALWLHAGGESVFLQDANTLIMRTDELTEVISFLKKTFPGINRITSYARSKTTGRRKPEELKELYDAGLSRLHIEMESGCDPLLQYIDKGATAAEHITGGRRVVESGISLS